MLNVARGLIIAAVITLVPACSLKTMAVKTVANTLAESGTVFSSDDDPELVRQAVPFALKTYESLLESIPRHQALLVATCSGFTQYAYAFVQTDADVVETDNYQEAKRLRARALKLYLRGRDYCLRAMEVRFPGIGPRLLREPAAALARAERKDVPLLYWTGASWGSAISLGLADPELVADFPAVRALMERALALDEAWNKGALHEAMIALDSLPEDLGGSQQHARQHFDRAVALQDGLSAGPYVALALGVSVANQDREEFDALLRKALAVDPEKDRNNRLVNLVLQRRAAALVEHEDRLFSK